MQKSPSAFRTIGEAGEILGVQAHVLRFWESKFSQIKPVKRNGGRRYYRPDDIALIRAIQHLLHDDGLTIKGAQKALRERGVKTLTAQGRALLGETASTPPQTFDRREKLRPLYDRLVALRASMMAEIRW